MHPKWENYSLFAVRSPRADYESLRLALDQQHVVLGPLRRASDVFNLVLVIIPKLIKPQAVVGRVDEGGELGLEDCILRRVQEALKHGILDPLTIIHTRPWRPSAAFAARRRFLC